MRSFHLCAICLIIAVVPCLGARYYAHSIDLDPDSPFDSAFAIVDLDTGEQVRTVPDLDFAAWSPDGTRCAANRYGDRGVYLCNPSTGEATFLGPGQFYSWSPDGRALLIGHPYEGSRDMVGLDLEVVDLQTGRKMVLEDSAELGTGGLWHDEPEMGYYPWSEPNHLWSEDGTMLAVWGLVREAPNQPGDVQAPQAPEGRGGAEAMRRIAQQTGLQDPDARGRVWFQARVYQVYGNGRPVREISREYPPGYQYVLPSFARGLSPPFVYVDYKLPEASGEAGGASRDPDRPDPTKWHIEVFDVSQARRVADVECKGWRAPFGALDNPWYISQGATKVVPDDWEDTRYDWWLYDLKGNRQLRIRLGGHPPFGTDFQAHPTRNLVATELDEGKTGRLVVMRLPDGHVIYEHQRRIWWQNFWWNPARPQLLVSANEEAGAPDSVFTVDFSGAPTRRDLFKVPLGGGVEVRKWSDDGSVVALRVGGEPDSLRLVNVDSGQSRTIAWPAQIRDRGDLMLSADGRYAVTVSPSGDTENPRGEVQIVETATGNSRSLSVGFDSDYSHPWFQPTPHNDMALVGGTVIDLPGGRVRVQASKDRDVLSHATGWRPETPFDDFPLSLASAADHPLNIATDPATGLPFVNDRLTLFARPGTNLGDLQQLVKQVGGEIIGGVRQFGLLELLLGEAITSDRLSDLEKVLLGAGYVYLVDKQIIKAPPVMPPPVEAPPGRKLPIPPAMPPTGIPGITAEFQDWAATGLTYNWGWRMAKLPQAWQISKPQQPIHVGVTDSGFDASHTDLQANVESLMQYPSAAEVGDHGTHVSGLAGAIGEDDYGICAPCWNVRLHLSAARRFVEDAQAFRDLSDAGCRIINCSWGINWESETPDGQELLPRSSPEKAEKILRNVLQTLRPAVRYARRHGVLIFASAGNDDGLDAYWNGLPALSDEFDNVITVMAVGPADTDGSVHPAAYTNVGRYCDIAAPGGNLWQGHDDRFGMISTLPGNKYEAWQGTSMASPFAASIAALIWSNAPKLHYTQVKHILLEGARRGDLQVNGHLQYVVNAEESLKLLAEMTREMQTASATTAAPEGANN